MRSSDVLDRKHGGNTAESDAIMRNVVHRNISNWMGCDF
jgi:hypothetical protein